MENTPKLTHNKRIVITSVTAFTFLLAVPVLLISFLGLRENIFPADVAVVLGNEVYADGTCSPRLAGRLERAVDLYRAGDCKKIIVSGGVGLSGFDEGVGMRNYLLFRRVPSEDIVVDSNGVNTRATARFTARYMKEHRLGSAIAVSQFFHIPRTVMTLRAEGVPRVGAAYARYFEWRDIFSTLREVPAYLAYAMGIK